MKKEIYFTRDTAVQDNFDLFNATLFALEGRDYSDFPELLDEGILYRVSIEKVGVVRTMRKTEVEFDSTE